MAKRLTKGKRAYLLKLSTESALNRLIAEKAVRQAQHIINERQMHLYMVQYC